MESFSTDISAWMESIRPVMAEMRPLHSSISPPIWSSWLSLREVSSALACSWRPVARMSASACFFSLRTAFSERAGAAEDFFPVVPFFPVVFLPEVDFLPDVVFLRGESFDFFEGEEVASVPGADFS